MPDELESLKVGVALTLPASLLVPLPPPDFAFCAETPLG
jgi:hypothetical protein